MFRKNTEKSKTNKLKNKLNNIKYPLHLPGSYEFENKEKAFECLQRNHELLNSKGSFNSSYPGDDPNCQELAAAVNLYLFNLNNKNSRRLNDIKRKYSYCQTSMYLNNFFGKIIKSNNILSLKELSRIVIRTSVANHLGLLRVNNPNYPIFRPLLEYSKTNVSWKPKIIINLKIVGQYLPKILSEYIEAPHLERANNCIYITNRNKSLDNIRH